MRKSVLAELAGENITEWSRNRLNKQIEAINVMLAKPAKDITKLVNSQVKELAGYEAVFELKSLNDLVHAEFAVPSERQITSAVFSQPLQVSGPYQGQLLESFIEDLGERAILRLDSAIRLGYAQGKTTPEIVRALDGAIDLNRRDITSVVRTSLAHTANEARQAVWTNNADIIKAVQWVSTLDDRTTQECASLDGTEWPIDSGPRPPAHINCRSTIVPVLDDRFAGLEKGATRTAKGEDGIESIPAKQTYYSWLKTQPAEFQNEAIGPTRGKLLRDGGLSAQRFAELQLGKSFEPLTLDQMRELDPLAFSRAGL